MTGRCYNVGVAKAFENRALHELNKMGGGFYDVEAPGIYVGTRHDHEKGPCVYIGQAKCLYKRYADYLMIIAGKSHDKRHFALSLRTHKDGDFSITENYPVAQLDLQERAGIKHYTDEGGTIYNVQSGGKNEDGNLSAPLRHATVINKKLRHFYNVVTKYWRYGKEITKKGLPTARSVKATDDYNSVVEEGHNEP